MPLRLKREHGCWVQQAQEIGENGLLTQQRWLLEFIVVCVYTLL